MKKLVSFLVLLPALGSIEAFALSPADLAESGAQDFRSAVAEIRAHTDSMIEQIDQDRLAVDTACFQIGRIPLNILSAVRYADFNPSAADGPHFDDMARTMKTFHGFCGAGDTSIPRGHQGRLRKGLTAFNAKVQAWADHVDPK